MNVSRITIIACAGLLALAGCGNQVQGIVDTGDEPEALPAEVLVPIQAALPERSDVSAFFETTARIQAENRVEVVSKGSGIANEVRVREGDRVKEGDILAVLDKSEMEAQINQSRVTVQQNRYQMEKAEEQLERGILSPYEAENARFMYEQAAATLQVQEVQLRNQTIRAPIGGIVTQRMIQQGIVVSPGMPVFSIVDPNSYVLPITPPEKELSRLSEGQQALVTIDSMPDETFRAHVRQIFPTVDPVSGTVRVILEFEPESRERLREAAFARVKLVMETRENVLVVPKDALIQENARDYLMVVDQEFPEDGGAESEPRMVARRKEVQTGLGDSNNIEITSGISDDSLIVTLGQHTLKAGSAVKITNAEEEIMSRAGLSAEEALSRSEEKRFDLGDGRDRREKLLR